MLIVRGARGCHTSAWLTPQEIEHRQSELKTKEEHTKSKESALCHRAPTPLSIPTSRG